MIDILFDGPKDATRALILAHSADAPMDSPFMEAFAVGLGAHGIRVGHFDFPYMAIRRAAGKQRPPDRQPILLQCRGSVIAQGERDALGGRGDVASCGLPKTIKLHWRPDGDRDLTLRKKSSFIKDGNWDTAMDKAAAFMASL